MPTPLSLLVSEEGEIVFSPDCGHSRAHLCFRGSGRKVIVPGPCGEENRPRLQPARTNPFKDATMNSTLNPSRFSLPWRLVLCLVVLAGTAGGCGKKGKKTEVSGKVVLLKKDGSTQD